MPNSRRADDTAFGPVRLEPMGEPTTGAIMAALADHRTESRVRWKEMDERLDRITETLAELPDMKRELAENTVITRQVAQENAFKTELRKRYTTVGVVAGTTAALIGLWVTIKSLFSGGPPPGVGPTP